MNLEYGQSRFPVTRLKYLAQVKSSNVDKVIDPDELPVRLCNYVDVYYNDFVHNDLQFDGGSASIRELEKFRLQVGDVIITKDSESPDDIAVPAYVVETSADLICGYHLALLRPLEGVILGKFLFYFLKSHAAAAAFFVRAQGVTRFGLSLGGIGSLICPSPSIAEQQLVVDFLDSETSRIDRMIERAGGKNAAKVAQDGSFLSLLLEHRAALITAAVLGNLNVDDCGRDGAAERRVAQIQEAVTK